MSVPTLYTVSEAAKLLRLKPGSVYTLCSTRKLRHQRVGGETRGRIRIPADALEDYLAGVTVDAEKAKQSAAEPAKRRSTFKHLRVS